MKGFGLVFSGGGGKGAYEIGVWKYLHETGLDNFVRAVSGTSVGALNAALYVGSSYEQAEDMWLHIDTSKILPLRKHSISDFIKWLGKKRIKMMAKVVIGGGAAFWTVETIAEKLLLKTKGDYFFSRDGLSNMITESLDFDMLHNSDIPCFVTCVRYPLVLDPLFRIERFKLNDYLPNEVEIILLASSAIPLVYPNEIFNGNKYCDGGIPVFGDNVPVKPVYDTGVENIIVVHLDREAVIDKSQFPDSNIIEVVPSKDLGKFLNGTLDFSPEGSKKRIDLGYEDAKKVIYPMLEMVQAMGSIQKSQNEMKSSMARFKEQKAASDEKYRRIRAELSADGFDDIYNELIEEE